MERYVSVKMTAFTVLFLFNSNARVGHRHFFPSLIIRFTTLLKTVSKNRTKVRGVFNYFYCFIFVKFSILIGAHKQRGTAIQK